MSYQSYPFDSLPKYRSDEVELMGNLHRAAPLFAGMYEQLHQVLGVPVSMEVAKISITRPKDLSRLLRAGWAGGLSDLTGDVVGVVHLDATLAQALAGLILGAETLGGPVEVRPVLPVEEHTLEGLISLLLGAAGVPLQAWTSEGTEAERALSGPLGRVALRLDVGGTSGFVSWFFELENADTWFYSDRSDALQQLPLWISAHPLADRLVRPIRLRVGTFSASLSDITELAIGDVLLPVTLSLGLDPHPAELYFGSNPVLPVALHWGPPLSFWVEADTQSRHPTTGGFQEFPLAKDTLESPAVGQATARTSAVDARTTLQSLGPLVANQDVELELVVGGLTMTLREALALRPGRVLTFPETADGPIELFLDGRPVGRAELVDIQGRMGLRIISLAM